MGVDAAESARRTYQAPTKFTGWANYGSPSIGTGGVKVTGLKELHAALQTLPAKIEANIMRGALRAAGVEYQKLARQKLSAAGYGKAAQMVRVNTRLRKGRVTANTSVGDRPSKGTRNFFWMPWLEWGTAAHYTGTGRSVRTAYHIRPKKKKVLKFYWKKMGMWFVTSKGVTHPGIAPGRFMTKSFDEGSGSAITATANYVRKRIDKYNQKQSEIIGGA